jgi:hypothetical protein
VRRTRAGRPVPTPYNDLSHLHVQEWSAAEPVIADVLNQAAEVGAARIARLLRGVVE